MEATATAQPGPAPTGRGVASGCVNPGRLGRVEVELGRQHSVQGYFGVPSSDSAPITVCTMQARNGLTQHGAKEVKQPDHTPPPPPVQPNSYPNQGGGKGQELQSTVRVTRTIKELSWQ